MFQKLQVECVQVEWPSNPYLRSRVLLLFMGFVILLPIGVASCQSNCVCFRRCAAREKGWWAGLKRALRACARGLGENSGPFWTVLECHTQVLALWLPQKWRGVIQLLVKASRASVLCCFVLILMSFVLSCFLHPFWFGLTSNRLSQTGSGAAGEEPQRYSLRSPGRFKTQQLKSAQIDDTLQKHMPMHIVTYVLYMYMFTTYISWQILIMYIVRNEYTWQRNGLGARTPDGLQRCFGAEEFWTTGVKHSPLCHSHRWSQEFGNLMIIPVPAPIPKKPAAPGRPLLVWNFGLAKQSSPCQSVGLITWCCICVLAFSPKRSSWTTKSSFIHLQHSSAKNLQISIFFRTKGNMAHIHKLGSKNDPKLADPTTGWRLSPLGFPRRWVHTALPNFHEVVELNLEGEGGEVAAWEKLFERFF